MSENPYQSPAETPLADLLWRIADVEPQRLGYVIGTILTCSIASPPCSDCIYC